MCKRVRTPDIARKIFSGNQLYGWPDGIQYEPTERKKRKRRKQRDDIAAIPLLPVQAVVFSGVEI